MYIIKIAGRKKNCDGRGRGGAQRPLLCGNELKKTGKYSLRALRAAKTQKFTVNSVLTMTELYLTNK